MKRVTTQAVQLQHLAATNGSNALANNTTLGHGGRQLRSQDGGPALPGHSGEDHAAEGGHQVANALLGAVNAAALASELRAERLHLGAADASALTASVGRGHFLGGGSK